MLPSTPNTELWAILYTQILQVDGRDYHNFLLERRRMHKIRIDRAKQRVTEQLEVRAEAAWTDKEVRALLQNLGLPENNPLSIITIELMQNQTIVGEPISTDLGKLRIYRTSQLEPVPKICSVDQID
ncbi:MAG: hypothetical protein P0116_17120 [Candidatus Nitrosocosmicus sp.]|nr:hypothetical protein [Candidatus Nitrosocosmicus sp.]